MDECIECWIPTAANRKTTNKKVLHHQESSHECLRMPVRSSIREVLWFYVKGVLEGSRLYITITNPRTKEGITR